MYRMLARSIIVLALLCSCVAAWTQKAAAPSPQQLKQLADAQRWEAIAAALAPVNPRTADMDFYYGMALARLGRWAAAESALQEGQRLAPADARFPIELAGVAFKQKKNALAERRLRRALHLDAQDAYANDFLATLYFLDDNVEAALKYWNRVGKPQIASVRDEPVPRVSPALLDHAFTFSPHAGLSLQQYVDTEMRLRGLGIFPEFQIGLEARDDGKFDVAFRARELNGLGDGVWEDVVQLASGLPFEEVDPELWNLHREAINLDPTFRWDAQKRRISAQISGPWEHGARYRWGLMTDLRNENWAVRSSFTGPAPVLASFNMRTARVGFDLASYTGGRIDWRAGAATSYRNFRSVEPGSLLTPQMLATGYELEPEAQITSVLWRVPEHRFTLTASAGSAAARLWSSNPEAFERLTGSLAWRWFPQARGDNYETTQQLRAGKIFGQPPFDELFILGLERDNDLPMHAHIGTRDGRKGSAPLGREYFLHNWELDKTVYGNGILKLKLGPLLDIGKIADPGTGLGSHEWLFDTGALLKLKALGSGVVFSYGRDLRTGNNAFYVMLLE